MEISKLRTILARKGYFSNLTKVNCTCGECDTSLDRPSYYTCKLCKRLIPFCNGQDDEYYSLCDECAIEAITQDEKTREVQLCQQ